MDYLINFHGLLNEFPFFTFDCYKFTPLNRDDLEILKAVSGQDLVDGFIVQLGVHPLKKIQTFVKNVFLLDLWKTFFLRPRSHSPMKISLTFRQRLMMSTMNLELQELTILRTLRFRSGCIIFFNSLSIS